MKKHLSIRLAVILCGMTASIVLLSWFLNTLFLEKYYKNVKSRAMEDTFEMVNDYFNNDAEKQYSERTIITQCEKESISVLVIDSSLRIKLSSGFSVEGDNLLQRLKDLIFDGKSSPEDIIVKKDNYELYEICDSSTKGEYLEVYGSLDNGDILVMRSSIDGIKNSVNVYHRFFVYVGFALIVICIFIIMFVARNVAKPIKNLADISTKMSHLDFSAKYEGDAHDEIGMLGNSMNIMSDKLCESISELKNANIKLQSDLEEKVKIDEMRKEFISNVSHELKTPITLISGYAEGLKECINDDDQQSRDFYCDVIIDEASKMNKMMMKLLTLNQIEFGGMQVDMERFDIIELIEQILANFKVMFDEKNIRVVFDNSTPCYVWTDEFQISEVLTNYISNAINHIDGEKIIFITISDDGDKVTVNVRNTGKNIPDSELENIWVKFYKVDKARTREYGGSGIGLSIVKAISNALKQNCGVRNTTDGVEFFFTVDSAKND